MTDIQVFDSKNPDRLLGTLTVNHTIRGETYSVVLMDELPPVYAMVRKSREELEEMAPTKIDFRIEWVRRTMAESQFMRTIEEKAHMTTDAKLSDLLKLDRFRLPEETKAQANARHRKVRSDFY